MNGGLIGLGGTFFGIFFLVLLENILQKKLEKLEQEMFSKFNELCKKRRKSVALQDEIYSFLEMYHNLSIYKRCKGDLLKGSVIIAVVSLIIGITADYISGYINPTLLWVIFTATGWYFLFIGVMNAMRIIRLPETTNY